MAVKCSSELDTRSGRIRCEFADGHPAPYHEAYESEDDTLPTRWSDDQSVVEISQDLKGVWACFTWDMNPTQVRVFLTEIEALRESQKGGYYQEVKFLPWGTVLEQG